MKEYIDDIKMKTIQFLVTEDCNLNCVYCYEKHKSNKSLSAKFIKEKIYEQMLENNGYEELSIDLFGGEPLLEFETIREIIEWFVSIKWPESAKAYRFTITTNGSLLDEERMKWFTKYSKILTLCLSLDGTRNAHNRNRSNSYDKVIKYIDFYRKTWPEQPIKMTISQYTLDQMYDGIVHIHELGLPVEANVVFENVWGNEEAKKIALKTYAEQLDRLVSFYYKNPHLKRPRLINKNIMSLYDHRHPGDNMFCGAGRHLMCWTADEKEFPCMRFSPISTSEPLQDKDFSKDTTNEKCQMCVFERLCPTCEGHNYEVKSSCFNRTDFHCEFFQLEMLASAKLFFLENRQELLRSDFSLSEEDNLNRLRRVLVIMAINDLCGKVIS
jgi:uncharacterized protein